MKRKAHNLFMARRLLMCCDMLIPSLNATWRRNVDIELTKILKGLMFDVFFVSDKCYGVTIIWYRLPLYIRQETSTVFSCVSYCFVRLLDVGKHSNGA